MRPSSTARRYAEAAFDVAREDGDTSGFLEDLRSASERLSEHSTALYFRDPAIAADEKLRAVDMLLPDARPHVLNLLRTLVARHRLHLLRQILDEFEELERASQGIAEAYVTVARPLTRSEEDEMSRRLGELMGKSVHLHPQVDPRILGGIVVRIGDRLFDASVAGRLERLRQELAV